MTYKTKYGQPGRYNSSLPTVPDGGGSALAVDSNGRLITVGGTGASSNQVQGTAADNAAAVGNPVRTGHVYNTAAPTYANGDIADFQADVNGNSKVASGTAIGSTASATGVYALGAVNPATGNLTGLQTLEAAANKSGTTILAAGIMAQLDETSPTTVTENQFGNVRMNAVRALYHENGPYLLGRATADTQIKATAGFVHSISIAPLTATPTAGLLTVYDSASETGTVIYSEWVFATTPGHTVILDIPTGTGIYVGFDATLANVQATLSYR